MHLKSIAIFLFLDVINFVTSTNINVINRCGFKVWVGVAPNPGKTILNDGGFLLNPNDEQSLDASNWAGNIFGRINCDPNGNDCDSANCHSGFVQCKGHAGDAPLTLAEFTINGWNNLDFYDLSLVKGFNVEMKIKPQNNDCKTLNCSTDMNQGCPVHLQKKKQDRVVACDSGDSIHPQGDPQFIKYATDVCPNAYAFWNDDIKTNSCHTGGSYDVIFCG